MQALLHSVPPTLQQATTDPHLHQRLLGTHGQIWVSLLWDHCSFLLGPGVYKVLFVPSKCLFPQSCVRSGSSMMGLMVTFSKRAYALCHTHIDCTQTPCPCCTQCSEPCSRPLRTHTSTRDSWTLTGKSGSVSCGITAPFSWVLVCTRFCLCQPRVCFPFLYKFWLLYGGVNGDLLQEGLCHNQDCCTQRPCPCSRPPPTCTSTGDAQTQFCLCLCGVPGSWGAQGWFEPSECL